MNLGSLWAHIGLDNTLLKAGAADAERILAQLDHSVNGKTEAMSSSFMAVGVAAITTFTAIASAGYAAIKVIDDLQVSVLQIAAQITQLQGPKNVEQNFIKAKEYSEAIVSKLQEIDAQSFANSKGLMAMNQALVMGGVILDVNNKKQVESFTALSNAIAMYTKGQDQGIQAMQEMRALVDGRVDRSSRLSMILDQQIKQQGIYKGGLKEVVQLGKQHGDLLERLSPYLVGINAASKDISKTWSAVSSSMETAVSKQAREGFAGMFADVVPLASQFVNWLKDTHSISEVIQKTWLSIKGVMVPIWEVLSMIVRGLDMVVSGSLSAFLTMVTNTNIQINSMWDVFKAIMNGIAFTASVLVPTLIEKIIDVVRVASGLIVVAASFGAVMWESIKGMADGFKLIGEGLWAALTGDMKGMEEAFGKIFSGSVREGFQKEVSVFRGTLEALGDDWKKLKSTAQMDARLDAFFQAEKSAKARGGKPPKTPPPPGDDEYKDNRNQVVAARHAYDKYLESFYERENAMKKNANALLLQEDQIMYDRGLMAADDYFKSRSTITQAALENEVKERQRVLAVAIADEAKARKEFALDATGNAATNVNKAYEAVEKARKGLNDAQTKLTTATVADAENYRKAVESQTRAWDEIQAQLAEYQGDYEKAAKIRIDLAHKEVGYLRMITEARKGNVAAQKAVAATEILDAAKSVEAAQKKAQELRNIQFNTASIKANTPNAFGVVDTQAQAKIEYDRRMAELDDLIKLEVSKQNSSLEKYRAYLEEKAALTKQYSANQVATETQQWLAIGGVVQNQLGQIAGMMNQQNEDQFTAWKALMIAQAIVSTAMAVTGILAAESKLGVAAIPLALMAGAIGAAQIGIIAGTQMQKRQFGGSVQPQSVYQINENGTEMLEMGGRSYLLTGTSGGNVVPADKITNNNGGLVFAPNIQIDARGSDAGVETKIKAAMTRAVDEALAQVERSMDRGGRLARASGRLRG